MKHILKLLLCWTCCLFAVGIPIEESVTIVSLENGIDVWLKPYPLPSQTVSCRVIAKNPFEAVPQVFSLDCPLDAFEEELPYFVDLCRESIVNEAQCKLAVVAVGDFEEKSLGEFLKAAFDVFSRKDPQPSFQMISVNASNDDDVYLSLSYPTSFREIKTDQDLKNLWIIYLLQSVVEERFHKKVKDVGGFWIPVQQTNYLLPYISTVAKGRQAQGDDPHRMLQALLDAMQEVKSSGFTNQELSEAKAKLQKNLIHFYQKNPTSNVLADYLASHCAFGAGYPEYSIFMTMSFKAISEIEKTDVLNLLQGCFQDATRHVEIAVPTTVELTVPSIQETLDKVKTDHVVINPHQNNGEEGPNPGSTSYSQLPLTSDEARIIYQIIDSVGNQAWYTLLFKQGELEKLGNKIQHVHPLKFLETVLTNAHLKKSMIQMEDFKPKWRGFLDGSSGSPGFIAKCNREADRNNFSPYLVGFCQAVKAHPEQIRHFVEKKEWEKLVRFLIKLEN